MDIVSIVVTVAGLCLFETVCSIDNAIINAEVLSTMQAKYRRWFLVWGVLIAVIGVRGILPWLIVWMVIGLAIYFTYGQRHSKLNKGLGGKIR